MSSYLRMFLDRRVAFIFALGLASGFPWSIIGKLFGFWLRDAGLSRADIAILGGVAMIYALNFLWAPLLDRVRLPWLYQRLGQRRSWVLLTQVGVAIGAISLALIGLSYGPMMVAVAAAFIVFSGATLDVAVDAYRIETIPREEGRKMAAGASAAIAGWWTGAGLPGAVAFIIAGRTDDFSLAFLFLAAFAVGLIVIILLVPEPDSRREQAQAEDETRVREALAGTPGGRRTRQVEAWLIVTVAQPFIEFFRRNGLFLALAILTFALIFRIGEAFMGRMTPVFYHDIGFSAEQVGWVSGVFGWVTMICFVALSGMINVRFGIFRGLMLSGIIMALANLNYALIALIGPNLYLFIYAELVDNLTTAFATVAYVSFISYLTSKVYTATQYALLSSISNLGRTSIAMVSGTLVTWLDSWAVFYVITTLMVIPSLILLWWIRHRLQQQLGDVFSKQVS